MEPGDKLPEVAQRFWADPTEAISDDIKRAARSLRRIANRLEDPCGEVSDKTVSVYSFRGTQKDVNVTSNRLLKWLSDQAGVFEKMAVDHNESANPLIRVSGFLSFVLNDRDLKRLPSADLTEAFEDLQDLLGSIIDRIDDYMGDEKLIKGEESPIKRIKLAENAERFGVNSTSRASDQGPEIFRYFKNAPQGYIHLKATLLAVLPAESVLEQKMEPPTEWQRRFSDSERNIPRYEAKPIENFADASLRARKTDSSKKAVVEPPESKGEEHPRHEQTELPFR